jgi:hypothetical protein
MLGMLKRHEVEILLKAGHSKTEVARLAGVSLCSVKRIAQESPVVHVDDAAERNQRQIGRPSMVASFRKQVVGILEEAPDLASLEILRRVREAGYQGGKTAEEGSTTKSGEGNEIKMTPDLRTLLQACIVGKEPEDYLFTRVQIRKGRNRPINDYTERHTVDFRSAWGRATKSATKSAGKPDLQFHDLWRFAARRLDRAGVGQKTAMAVMGRTTDSIYRRYNIVDHRDRDLDVDRLVEYQEALAKASQIAAGQKQRETNSMQFDRQPQDSSA